MRREFRGRQPELLGPINLSALAEHMESPYMYAPPALSSRAKEFKTRLGIFLHKSDLSSDAGNAGKPEWNNKHSKER